MRPHCLCWVFSCVARAYLTLVAAELADGFREIVPGNGSFVAVVVYSRTVKHLSVYNGLDELGKVTGICRCPDLVEDYLECIPLCCQLAHGLYEVLAVRGV